MDDVLLYCNQQVNNLDCCHDGRSKSDCNCYECLRGGFYLTPDEYSCPKKLCYYVMNYGPSFASEIYHYLTKSKIIDIFKKENKDNLNILSLGCGFAPDMYAIDKYKHDNSIPISIFYKGYDIEQKWEEIRKPLSFSTFERKDLLSGFDLSNYDIVIINKLYSTLFRNKISLPFINILNKQINSNLPNNSYIVFIDILGDAKDEFDSEITGNCKFCKIQYYYFKNGTYNHKFRSTKINNIDNVFNIPKELKISPKSEVNKTIIFEYRK